MNDIQGKLGTPVHFFTRHVLVAAGTATYAGVDLKDFIGNVNVTISLYSPVTDGSTTAVISFLESADNTTFATWAAAPTPVTCTAASLITSVAIDTRACKRYVQAKHVVTGTTATFDLAVTGVGLKATMP